MSRKLLTIGAGVVFATVNFAAWAGPNDGPKYSNMATGKQYTDQPIADHNNRAPRYPVTASGKQFEDKRIMDQNNRAPRYPVTAAGAQAGNQTARVSRAVRPANATSAYPVHRPRSTHATRALAHHG